MSLQDCVAGDLWAKLISLAQTPALTLDYNSVLQPT